MYAKDFLYHESRWEDAMSRSQVLILAGVLAVGPVAGVFAATQSASVIHSKGWRYGRDNCGPIRGGLTSETACRLCCKRGAEKGNYPASEIGNCHRFCKIADWSSALEQQNPNGAPLPADPDNATGHGFVTCGCGT